MIKDLTQPKEALAEANIIYSTSGQVDSEEFISICLAHVFNIYTFIVDMRRAVIPNNRVSIEAKVDYVDNFIDYMVDVGRAIRDYIDEPSLIKTNLKYDYQLCQSSYPKNHPKLYRPYMHKMFAKEKIDTLAFCIRVTTLAEDFTFQCLTSSQNKTKSEYFAAISRDLFDLVEDIACDTVKL